MPHGSAKCFDCIYSRGWDYTNNALMCSNPEVVRQQLGMKKPTYEFVAITVGKNFRRLCKLRKAT